MNRLGSPTHSGTFYLHFFHSLTLSSKYILQSFDESGMEIYKGWTACLLAVYCSLDTTEGNSFSGLTGLSAE